MWMPNLQSAFWLLVALTSQFTVLMYIFVFVSAIKLRGRERGFLFSLLTLLAILASGIAFLFGLFPLQSLSPHYTLHYVLMMLVGDCIILALPLVLFKKSCIKPPPSDRHRW
jgi:amino acid transporter